MRSTCAPLALIVLGHLSLGAWSANHHSATVDEPSVLTGGYILWRTGSTSIEPTNPPLAKLMISSPLLFQRIKVPWDTREWRGGFLHTFAERLFFWSGNDAHAMLFSTRAVNVALSGLLVVLLWLAARPLGRRPALLCAIFYAFSPAVLANASLATNDFPAAFFTTLAFLAYLRFARQPGRDRALPIAAAALAAVLSKFTAVLIWPCLASLVLIAPPAAVSRMRSLTLLGLYGLTPWLAAMGLAVLIYPEQAGGFLFRVWEVGSRGHPTFLVGQVSQKGWWWYYLAAFLFKSTLPEIAVVAAGCWLGWKRRGLLEAALPLAVFAVYGAVTSWGNKQVGLRYILPVYPMLALLAAAVARRLFKTGAGRRLAVLFLGGLQFVSAAAAAPRFLSYFNPAAGGPSNGYRLLVDSNLDWGQDLREFARLHREQGRPEVILSYFGGHAVEYLGIKAQHLRTHNNIQLRWRNSPDPDKEWLVVSATNLQGVYIPPETFAWLKKRDPSFRVGHSLFIYDITSDADAHERLAAAYSAVNDAPLAARENDRARRLRSP